MSQIQFPSLSRRYFATTVDVLFLIAWVLLGVKTLTYFDVPTTSVIWYLVVLPVLLYEPVMTSKVVTLGQWLFKFRIRDVISGQRINLKQAYGRWIVKFILGGLSLLTIPNDSQRRAIHDKMLASVAINTN